MLNLVKWIKQNIRFSWQNLNETRTGRIGYGFFEGRAWLSCGEKFSIKPSWNFQNKELMHMYLQIDENYSDDDLSFSVAFPPVALWLSFDGILPRDVKRKTREYGIHFITDFFSINFGAHPHEWTNYKRWSKKWLKQGSFTIHIADILFGKKAYEERLIEERDVEIPMPEGLYPAHAKLEEVKQKRPRYPFCKYLVHADIKMEKPILHPGKGTMSYNCGEDALHGLSIPAKTIEDAIGATVACALDYRKRYPL